MNPKITIDGEEYDVTDLSVNVENNIDTESTGLVYDGSIEHEFSVELDVSEADPQELSRLMGVPIVTNSDGEIIGALGDD